MVPWLILAATILALGYVAGKLYARFMDADGTIPDRLWAAVKGSATVAVSYLGIVVMALPEALSSLATVLDDPSMRDKIAALFPPEYAQLVGFGLMIAVYVARQRTL